MNIYQGQKWEVSDKPRGGAKRSGKDTTVSY